MPTLPSDVRDKISVLLLPEVTRDRERILIESLQNDPVYDRIDRSGAPDAFVARLIHQLSHRQLVDVLKRLQADKGVENVPHIEDVCTRILQCERLSQERNDQLPAAPFRKALLRGLLPFEDGDELPGRNTEIQDLVTILSSADFQFGVVWGQTGCGKTSLLRAGLTPHLRRLGFHTEYIQRPLADFVSQLRSLLGEWVADSLSPAIRDDLFSQGQFAPMVVIIDQFEELFLQQKSKEQHSELAGFISRAMASKRRHIIFLVGIREEYFVKLHYLSPAIPDPTRPRTCYEIEELPAETAREILRTSADTDKVHFDETLIGAIVDDLETDGRVRAVELQIVATKLKRLRARKDTDLVVVGGARGVLKTYIEDEIASAAPNQQIASLVLRRLCAVGQPAKSPTDVPEQELADEVVRAGLDVGPESVTLRSVLSRLEGARLIVRPAQGLYNLVHDFVAPLIRLATAGVETNAERANRLLMKYLGEYREDPQFRIPWRHVQLVRRFANRTTLNDKTAKKLLRASVRTGVLQIALPIAVTIVIGFLAAYALLPFFVYFSTKPSIFAGGSPSIVVRAGHPTLKYLPGFGRLLADLQYSMDDVSKEDPSALDSIPRESRAVWQWSRTAGGYAPWGDVMSPILNAPARVTWQRLLSRPDAALETATPELAKGDLAVAESLGLLGAKGASDTLALATRLQGLSVADKEMFRVAKGVALGEIAQGADVGSLKIPYQEVFKFYVDIAKQPEKGEVRNIDYSMSRFDLALRYLMTADAKVLDERGVQTLLSVQADPKFEVFRSWSLLRTLRTIAAVDPNMRRTIFQRLLSIFLADQQSDRTRRAGWNIYDELRCLVWIAEVAPETVTREALTPLIPLAGKDLSPTIALGVLAQNNSALRFPDAVGSLRACSQNGGDTKTKYLAAACSLTLLRIGADTASDSVLTRLLSNEEKENSPMSTRDYLAWSARRIALGVGGTNSIFDMKTRSDFFRTNIQTEANRTPAPHVEDTDSYYRFYEVAKQNSDIVQNDVVETLIDICESPVYSGGDLAAAKTLLAAASWRPAYLSTQRARLFKIQHRSFLRGEDSETLHALFIAALARAEYIRRKTEGKMTIQEVRALLTQGTSFEQRKTGVYSAFLLWMDQPTRRSETEEELQRVAASTEPEIRASANEAREMIWVAKLTLVDGISVSRALARARLDLFAEHPEIHIQTAARLSMEKFIDGVWALRKN